MTMNRSPVSILVGDAPEIQAYLAERIYEFNSKATGYFDGEDFSATQRDESNAIRAGIYGYTWGGCCYVSYLWVDEAERGRGIGTALLVAAEEHAKARGCKLVLLSTHSFQAPAFYERLGYKQQAVMRDHPVGHASLYYAKPL
jgi:GNAT superfamily N-acetyltransferase